MTIFLWFANFVSYVLFMLYLTRRPSDLNLAIGLVALLTGFFGLASGRKLILIGSFLLIFFGVVLCYPLALRRDLLLLWGGELVITLFLGSLALRED